MGYIQVGSQRVGHDWAPNTFTFTLETASGIPWLALHHWADHHLASQKWYCAVRLSWTHLKWEKQMNNNEISYLLSLFMSISKTPDPASSVLCHLPTAALSHQLSSHIIYMWESLRTRSLTCDCHLLILVVKIIISFQNYTEVTCWFDCFLNRLVSLPEAF